MNKKTLYVLLILASFLISQYYVSKQNEPKPLSAENAKLLNKDINRHFNK